MDDVACVADAAELRPAKYPPAAARPIERVLQPSSLSGGDEYDEFFFADFRGFMRFGSSSFVKRSFS